MGYFPFATPPKKKHSEHFLLGPTRMVALSRHKHLTARFLETAMIPKILSALLLLFLTGPSWAQSLDLLIRNGSVLDGSGSPAKQVDIGIRGDRVVLIGKDLKQKASRIIDAHGLIVAPGFVDPHSAPFDAPPTPATSRNDAYLMQGVT